MMGTTDILSKHLYNLSYDLERDFVPITMIEKLPGAIVARANLPVKSVADLITHAKGSSWRNDLWLDRAWRLAAERKLEAPRVRLVTMSVQIRADLLADGECVTMFPTSVANHYGLRPLQVDFPVRPWPVAIVTLRNRSLSPVA